MEDLCDGQAYLRDEALVMKLSSRIKDENERRLISEFLAQEQALSQACPEPSKIVARLSICAGIGSRKRETTGNESGPPL
jgi:hypothetical protein